MNTYINFRQNKIQREINNKKRHRKTTKMKVQKKIKIQIG